MSLAVITATAREMKAVIIACGSSRFDLPAEGEYSSATLAGREVFLLITGIGPVNAAGALGRLAGAEKTLSGVVNAGTAGTFDTRKAGLGSIVEVTREVYPEFGLITEQGIEPRRLGLAAGKHPKTGKPIWNTLDLEPEEAIRLMKLNPGAERISGTSLTVAGVAATPQYAEHLKTTYSPLIQNMEGFSLAWTSLRNAMPFYEIRIVSDCVGQAPEKQEITAALNKLSSVVENLLKH